MKNNLLFITAMAGTFALAQVGINTNTPTATLEIVGTNDEGAYVTNDGVLIPQVNAVPAIAGSEEGELVYVMGNGFYYFESALPGVDGMLGTADDVITWLPLASGAEIVDITRDAKNNHISSDTAPALVTTEADDANNAQNNILIGSGSGAALTDSDDNILIGENAGSTITGLENIMIGKRARSTNATVNRSIAIGPNAVVTRSNEIVIGTSGQDSGTTQYATIIGSNQIDLNASSDGGQINLNTRNQVNLGSIGTLFGGTNDDSNNNVTINADQSITIGTQFDPGGTGEAFTPEIEMLSDEIDATSILNLDDGNGNATTETPGNVIIHPNLYSAADTETTFDNTNFGTGNYWLSNGAPTSPATGFSDNLVVGNLAADNVSLLGNQNTIVGVGALQRTNNAGGGVSGSQNTFLGYRAGSNKAWNGDNNIVIGTGILNSTSTNNYGSDNIFIGRRVQPLSNSGGQSVGSGIENTVALGAEATVDESNEVQIGSRFHSVVNIGTPTISGEQTERVNIYAASGGTYTQANDAGATIAQGIFLEADTTVNGTLVVDDGATTVSFPDYVFQNHYGAEYSLNPEYKLMSLDEVEAFTKANYHLPGITSAANVAEQGLNVGEMMNGQLEKIEELYLHTIAQEKQIKKLEVRNEKLEIEVTTLKKIEAENTKLASEVAELKAMVKQLLQEKK